MDKSLFLKRQKMVIRSLYPLEPSEFCKEMGGKLCKLASQIINIDCEDRNYVVMSYYCAKLGIYLGQVSELRNSKIAYINALTVEFLADFLMFTDTPDSENFSHLFSKYMKNLELANHNQAAAKMCGEIYSRFTGKSEFNVSAHYAQASVGILFIILHEWSHLKSELIENAIQLFHQEPTANLLSGLSEEMLVELACDFSSLNMLKFMNISKAFGISKMSKILEVVLTEVVLGDVYELLHGVLINKINESQTDLSRIMAKMQSTLTDRLNGLLIITKVAINSGFFFSKEDLMQAFEHVSKGVMQYIESMGNYLMDELAKEIEAYNAQPIKRTNHLFSTDTTPVWILFE